MAGLRPQSRSDITGAFVNSPRFTPGATSRVSKIDYTLVRTRGPSTKSTHAVGGSPRSRIDIVGDQTLCGVRVSRSGALLDYKRPGGPTCKACRDAIFKHPQEIK